MRSLPDSLVWLRRIAYCRGFGVQSPSVYSFIRYVVSEHYPFYAYADLRKAIPDMRGRERRLCQLYFRIANNRQAGHWLVVGRNSTGGNAIGAEAERQYINAGCRNTMVEHLGYSEASRVMGQIFAESDAPVVATIAQSVDASAFAETFCTSAREHDLLIVEGIGTCKSAKCLWQKVTTNTRVSVSLDLFYCGIAFFDHRYKQNFKVNF